MLLLVLLEKSRRRDCVYGPIDIASITLYGRHKALFKSTIDYLYVLQVLILEGARLICIPGEGGPQEMLI